MELYQITTTPQQAAKGQHHVALERKSTKANPVAESERCRYTLIPSFPSFTVCNSSDNTDLDNQQVFRTIVADALGDAAKSILKDYFLQNKTAATIPAEVISFAAIVARIEQDQQTSERLNSEQIVAWYDASTIPAKAAERYQGDAAKVARMKAAFASVASNNSGITAKNAATMLTMMEAEVSGDAVSTVAAAVASRLSAISKRDTSDAL